MTTSIIVEFAQGGFHPYGPEQSLPAGCRVAMIVEDGDVLYENREVDEAPVYVLMRAWNQERWDAGLPELEHPACGLFFATCDQPGREGDFKCTLSRLEGNFCPACPTGQRLCRGAVL